MSFAANRAALDDVIADDFAAEVAAQKAAVGDGRYQQKGEATLNTGLSGTLKREIHQYASPRGLGLLGIYTYSEAGEVHKKRMNHGPESWIAKEWEEQS